MNQVDWENQPASSEWVRQNFVIGDLLGSGTFGNVYQVECRKKRNQLYALKELSRGSLPKFIAMELKVLHKFGGQANVMSIHAAYREKDRVFIVMDYFPHLPLKDVITYLSIKEILDYMKNLFIALEYLHRNNIVHRDIKPANFLFNRAERRYALIDFGLSHEFHRKDPRKNVPQQQRRVRISVQPQSNRVSMVQSPRGRKSPNENTTPGPSTVLQRQFVKRLNTFDDFRLVSSGPPAAKISRLAGNECDCLDEAQVCVVCENRPNKHINKAGTPGFRAPEILLRFDEQSPKLDIWSAGVTMLSLLLKRHPVFRPADDVEALAQIAQITGIDILAEMLIARDGLNAIKNSNHELLKSSMIPCDICPTLVSGNQAGYCICKKSEPHSISTLAPDMQLCVYLVQQCLQPDPIRRFSASMLLDMIRSEGY
ncbi:hypothetical protein WR25_27297 [Diploscapter pachys]|uniref:non-specific serine/threonine protein kinase n=1 Tax=Diploscapter pachys TaxID=2018661 RepID=A0A2A2K5Z0_9BILA|nr:hypothetical protein WR25_27297 [Diploscapter pachys]